MNSRTEDVFDRLMKLPVLCRFQPFFGARRVKLLYLFFGALSFLLNTGSYGVFLHIFSIHALAANILSWVLTVAFVYETNRRWVFEAEQKHGTTLRKQVLSFYAGRIVTLLAEETIMAVLTVYLRFPGIPVKVFAQIVVILLNYFISKKFIFRKQR